MSGKRIYELNRNVFDSPNVAFRQSFTVNGDLDIEKTDMSHFDDRIVEMSSEKVSSLAFVIFVISLFMLIGLIGNPLAIYFYGFHLKRSASHMFISVLAVFDLATCAFSMPMEIVDIVQFYTFENVGACKTFRFFNYFSSITSGVILVAIAVDRYRRVCEPFKEQISRTVSKWIILTIVIWSFFLSTPSFVIYDIVPVNITNPDDDSILIGYDCTTIRNDAYKLPIMIYNSFLFFLFLITIVILIVLYCLVGKQLFHLRSLRFFRKSGHLSLQNHVEISTQATKNASSKRQSVVTKVRKMTQRMKRSSSKIPITKDRKDSNVVFNESLNEEHTIPSNMESVETQQDESSSNKPEKRDSSGFVIEEDDNCPSVNLRVSRVFGLNTLDNRESEVDRNKRITNRKYTILTITITATFISTFLPHLSLITWRTLTKGYEGVMFSGAKLVFYQLFIRSQLFSSAFNPIIYGFLNAQFRHVVGDRFTDICCRKHSKPIRIIWECFANIKDKMKRVCCCCCKRSRKNSSKTPIEQNGNKLARQFYS